MNLYFWIILFGLIGFFIIDLIADLLNLKSLKPEIPEEFRDVYDAERYRKSQDYTRTKIKFGILRSSFDLLLLLGFWFAGGFNLVDQWVREFGMGPIMTGVAYFGILGLGARLLSLPFSIYGTFVIEEKFGFNKTTIKTYVLDLVKGLFLGVLIGGPILAGILGIFETVGPKAWMYGWTFMVLVSLTLTYVAPNWIMPLFNKFTPLQEGELKKEIFNYAQKVQFPLKEIFVMDGSKRSAKSNAFFTGFGKNKRIALFDTLINNHSVSELLAVVAHEVGHYKKRHIIQHMIFGIIQTGVLLFLASVFIQHSGLFEAFKMEQKSVYAGLLFFSFLLEPISQLMRIPLAYWSRVHEYEADRFAAETTRTPNAIIDALKKLSKDNLSNLTPHPFYVALHYSHPPVLQRVKAIRKLEAA